MFAILIAATFWLGGVNNGSTDDSFLLNLMFYIIITPIITVTMTKMMYAGENTMIVEDALNRMDGLLEKKPLPQAVDSEKPKDASISFKNVSFRYAGGS